MHVFNTFLSAILFRPCIKVLLYHTYVLTADYYLLNSYSVNWKYFLFPSTLIRSLKVVENI